MNWVLIVVGTWIAVGCALALVVGRSIYLANVEAAVRDPEDAGPSPVVPTPVVEQHTPLLAPMRRQTTSPASSARSPFIGDCVSPSERAPSEHEHGLI